MCVGLVLTPGHPLGTRFTPAAASSQTLINGQIRESNNNMTTNTDRIKELERKLAMLTESNTNTANTEASPELSEFTQTEKTALEEILNGLPSDAVVYSVVSLVLGKKAYSKSINEKIANACNIESKLKQAGISGKASCVVMPLSFSRYFD